MISYTITTNSINEEFFDKIESGVICEDLTIEFKSQLYNLSLKDVKKDFLRDVSAMLNSKGGVILLGIGDDGEILGVEIDNLDLYKRQIQQVVNTGIEPQVTGIDFKNINYNDKSILCILIPNLQNKPYCHKVMQSQYREFLIRNNGINHHLSMSEIKRLFLGQDSIISQSWDDWKINIVNKVKSNNWIKPLESTKSILLFVNPTDTNPKDNLIETTQIKKLCEKNTNIWPPHSSGCTHIPFESGIFALGRPKGDFGENENCYSFVVSENNSAVYYYDSWAGFSRDDSRQIYSGIAETVLSYVRKASKFLESAGFKEHRYEVSLYILDAKGYKVARDQFFYAFPGAVGSSTGIPTDLFELSTKFFIGDDVEKVIKPILDKLWQTSGFDNCLNYDENGILVSKY
jgi:hypothetical protein